LYTALAIVFGILAVLHILGLAHCRPHVPQILTAEQLDELRIRREAEREALLEEEVGKLQARVSLHRHNRLVLTARRETAALVEEGEERWDARGRQVYGDAWDNAVDGN
ncbi:unnamed protein product, partial [Phaeothamnion confervicola]